MSQTTSQSASHKGPIHIAVVGVGKVAVQNYLPALVNHGDVHLHYYNRTPEKAIAAAQQFGGEAAATVEALMAANPDTVLVLTKETTRAEITESTVGLCAQTHLFRETARGSIGPGSGDAGRFLASA